MESDQIQELETLSLNPNKPTKSTKEVHFDEEENEIITLPTAHPLGNDQDFQMPLMNAELEAQASVLTPTAAAELSAQQSRLACRFYAEKFPEVDSLVMVNVRQIADMGAYVHLLEYNNIEGMILLSELSRRRIRSIQKLIRVGRNEAVVVLRVDKEKGNLCSLTLKKDTLISQNVGSLPKTWPSAKKNSKNLNRCPFLIFIWLGSKYCTTCG